MKPASTAHDPANSRLPALDGLRAIAILLVLFHHFSQEMPIHGEADQLYYALVNSFWLGLDLFFVLSGFLITGILFDAKGSAGYFRTFYARRSLRIFPIYYVLLLVIFSVLPGLGHSIIGVFGEQHERWFWLYGSNYLTGLMRWPDRALAHLWSLAIEEHFYLLWPFVVFALGRRNLLRVGLLVLAAGVALRYAYASDHTSATAIYVMTHFRLDTLVTGGVLAIAWRTPALRLRLEQHAGKVALALLAIIGAWLVGKAGLNWPSWSAAQQAGGYSLIAIFFAALHVLSLRLSPSSTIYRVLSSYPAIQLGKLSYGIYLFHLPPEVVARNLGYHPKLQVAAAQTAWPTVVGYTLANAAVATLAAWLTWNLFEKHVLRLKDYFTYRKSAAK